MPLEPKAEVAGNVHEKTSVTNFVDFTISAPEALRSEETEESASPHTHTQTYLGFSHAIAFHVVVP